MLSFYVAFAALVLSSEVLTAAHPLLNPYSLVQKRSAIPSGWFHIAKHNPSSTLPLRFGLTQSNIDNLHDWLLDISDPESPNYGNHWTPAEVANRFRPSRDTIHTVRKWLIRNGIHKDRIRVSHTRTWIELNATVEEAERLLQTEYHVYEHHTGTKHIACESYYLPEHITPHVELVTPTIDFTATIRKRESSFDGHPSQVSRPDSAFHPRVNLDDPNIRKLNQDHCDTNITISCLRSLYDFHYTPKSPSKNSLGIVEYTPQSYVPSDLDLFSSVYAPSLKGKRPILKSIDGGVLGSTLDPVLNIESNIDLQYGMALVTAAQPVTLYQVGDIIEGASFNNFLDALDGSYCTFEGGDDPVNEAIYPDPAPGGYNGTADCGKFKPAYVISTSYSMHEVETSPAYNARQCAEYAKLGLMGVTVVYPSGDGGVAGNNRTCLNADGSETLNGTIFNPIFPSTCPYVTSTGATQVNPGSSVTAPESSFNFSGGGFSNQFKMPKYQKAVMEEWRKHHLPDYPASVWNSTGVSRGYPDLAVNGANYVVAVDGNFTQQFGTSISTTVVAAMLTMINDARITAHKKPIGFINPTIYSAAFQSAFNDITTGQNPGCGTDGFSAVKGWDPVTGLGTPNFPKLLARFLQLP